MIQAFKKYIENQNLFQSEDKILLAVSGGMDSVCMSHIFAKAGFVFGIAHCNFKLRKKESDEDADFVKTLANELGVECFVQNFQTEEYASDKKISIQMAARNLRYGWFEEVRLKNDFNYLATAHHLNDSIETVVYNFAKGCGIKGLHGISPKIGKIIRPLLFAKRSEIEDYVQSNKLTYREDASNASDKYSRNFIRHQIIPLLKDLNPSFENSASETIKKIRETEFIFDQMIEHYKNLLMSKKGEEVFIDFKKIPKEAAHTVLYEILHPMGFNGDQVKMMLDQEHQSGITFYSPSHILLIDRDCFIIQKNEIGELSEQDIPADTERIMLNGKTIEFKVLENVPMSIPGNPLEAFLDYDKLNFPLTLRPWKPGDQFQPIGMGGKHQKIQDFLTHKKLSRFEKERTYIMESAGKICWVPGMRIDERFKITGTTKRCYLIKISEV